MTQPPASEPAPVEQVDRDAAAKWAKSNSRHLQSANIKRGSCDNPPIVQAFARAPKQVATPEIPHAE